MRKRQRISEQRRALAASSSENTGSCTRIPLRAEDICMDMSADKYVGKMNDISPDEDQQPLRLQLEPLNEEEENNDENGLQERNGDTAC